MSSLTDRVSYLKGLAAGMKLNMDKDSNKLLMEVLGVMSEMADEMQRLDEEKKSLEEYVESIDQDLSDMEEALYNADEDDDADDEDTDDACDCEDCADEDADDADDDDDGHEIDELDEAITYVCPNCGEELIFRASDIDFDENTLCPKCHKPIFPEIDEGSEESENLPF